MYFNILQAKLNLCSKLIAMQSNMLPGMMIILNLKTVDSVQYNLRQLSVLWTH
jgi:hypothetical protein